MASHLEVDEAFDSAGGGTALVVNLRIPDHAVVATVVAAGVDRKLMEVDMLDGVPCSHHHSTEHCREVVVAGVDLEDGVRAPMSYGHVGEDGP